MKILIGFVITIFMLSSNLEAAVVRITGLSDADAGTWSGQSGAINVDDDLCIYSDTGNYIVTASGSGNNNRFRVDNGSEFVNYTVRWNNQTGTSGQVQLTKDVASDTQTTSETVSDDCSGGTNLTAHLQVRFSNNQLQSNLSGSYSGTLTLVIGAI